MSRIRPEALHQHVDRKMREWERDGTGIGPDGTIWASGQALRLRAVFDYGVRAEGEERDRE